MTRPRLGRARDNAIEIVRFLRFFIRDPMSTIRAPLDIRWQSTFLMQTGTALIASTFASLLSPQPARIWAAFGLFLLVALLASQVLTFFFASFFSAFQGTFLERRRLYAVVAVASLPYIFIHGFSGFLPPIDLIGFALTSALLVVGLSEQFSLDKTLTMRLVGVLYLLFLIAWAAVQIQSHGAP